VAQEKIIYFGVGAQTLFELANLAFLRVGCSFKLPRERALSAMQRSAIINCMKTTGQLISGRVEL